MFVSLIVIFTVSCAQAFATSNAVERLQRTSSSRYVDQRYGAPRVALAANVSAGEKESFFVDGRSIPLLSETVQSSYAGLLPIGANDSRKLFFWYWPSSANDSDTLAVWLNGGPGCSSMTGFLSELGTYTFRPGTPAPTINAHAWSTVSDVVFIDQPFGVGFSKGDPDVTDEQDVADEFYGFLRNFYAVFPELLTKKLFITGESYAGFYIPYIAQRILSARDAEKVETPIDLQGILINDGVYSSFILSQFAPMADFVTVHQDTLGFSDGDVSRIVNASIACELPGIMNQLTYPPRGPLIMDDAALNEDCLGTVISALDRAKDINPCYNYYRITDTCPTPPDPLEGYFSRADIQETLHVAGFGNWTQCVETVFPNGDPSAFSETLFPELIAALPHGVALWHGLLDMLLLANGTRLTIQNLTWAGVQGFQAPITQQIVLDGTPKGLVHSERGLTYYEIADAGHMIPADQPVVALEVFKTLLGKPSSLTIVASGNGTDIPAQSADGGAKELGSGNALFILALGLSFLSAMD